MVKNIQDVARQAHSLLLIPISDFEKPRASEQDSTRQTPRRANPSHAGRGLEAKSGERLSVV